MALKDQLNDALQATPADNTARQQTLRAVLASSGGGSDAEIKSALSRLISEREAKTATFMAAGKTDAARAERAEIDALRALLKLAVTSAPAATSAPTKKVHVAAPPPEEPAKPLLSKQHLIIGGLAVIVLAGLAYYFLSPKSDSTNGSSATPIVVQADDRTLGDPKAKIVMLEYAAPTCPACAHFNNTIMPRIKAEYIDTGKVFYIFRTFPLSATDGAVEGIARLCLPADKYFQYLDLMYRNQPKWDPDGYQIPDVGAAVRQMAGIMGISPNDADRCMTDATEQARVNKVAEDGQKRYNINSTPTIIVNGQILLNSERTYPLLKARFDALLANKNNQSK